MPTLTISFEANEPLADIRVDVTGPETATLHEGHFVETAIGDSYHYEGTITVTTDGEYTSTLTNAADIHGNDAMPNTSEAFVIEPAISENGVARWTFDDESDTTTATDSWGTNDATISGASYTTAAQVESHALSLDGVDDEVRVSGFPDLGNSFTQMAWAYPDTAPLSGWEIITINGNQGGARDYKSIIQDDGSGNLRVNIGSGSSMVTAGSFSYSSRTWYHVAATYDGSRLRFYADGSLQDSTSTSLDTYTTDEVYHGFGVKGDGTHAAHWDGRIDDIRYYDRALSGSEIQDIYTDTK